MCWFRRRSCVHCVSVSGPASVRRGVKPYGKALVPAPAVVGRLPKALAGQGGVRGGEAWGRAGVRDGCGFLSRSGFTVYLVWGFVSAAPSNGFSSGLRLLARLFLGLLGSPRNSCSFSLLSLSTSLRLCLAFLFSLCSSRCSDVGGELPVCVPRLPRLLLGLLWLLFLLVGLLLPENNTASCLTFPGLMGRIKLRDPGASLSIS